jgi:hypothetical protein
MTHSLRNALRAALILALLASCGARGPSPRRGRPDAPGSAVHFSRPPVIDGSRRACLEPPYTPPHDATSLEDGTIVTMRGEGRTWQLKTPGTRDATFEEIQALMQRLRARGGAFQFVSHGVYCDEHMCLAWSGNLCEVNVLERYAELRAAIAEDAVLADARIEIAISLAGNLGPRCAADDPACLPIPYEGGTYDPTRGRQPGVLATHSAGACTHDGECMEMGCGNHCLSWDHGGAHEGATCEGYSIGRPLFCGCVEGSCAWFTQ